jgi:hypothetical protein
MKITIELDLAHIGDTGRDDPERLADFVFYQRLDGETFDAGHHGEARYEVKGFRFVSGEGETDDAGNDLDVLQETVG